MVFPDSLNDQKSLNEYFLFLGGDFTWMYWGINCDNIDFYDNQIEKLILRKIHGNEIDNMYMCGKVLLKWFNETIGKIGISIIFLRLN